MDTTNSRAARVGKTRLVNVALACALLPAFALACGTPLTTQRVASGLSSPVFVTAPPGDTDRLFIVQQGGAIKILNLQTLVVNATPFITIPVTSGSEAGLLGMAFDPQYASNRYFYVDYTRSISGQLMTFVSRFTTSAGNPDVADPNSELVILSFNQPFSNHNAGWLAFGPDGYLYIATGDGGSEGDPQNNGQTITNNRLGEMLRIDVSNSAVGHPYDVPPDNPFVGVTGDDEIWAYGLRNPWRDSFDRLTGDFYIGDVGQSTTEEIDFQPAGSPGGQNYGWRCYEGNNAYNTSGCAPANTMTFPIYTYSHAYGCAIIGGYVYRGPKIWDLRGTYFFSDNCSSQLWTFRYVGGQVTDFRNRTSEMAPGGGLSIDSVSSFGEDAAGELYICDLGGGEIYKIVPDGPVVGDLNGDGVINNFDINAFVLALTDPSGYDQQYPNIDRTVIADINCDGSVNNFDINPFVALLAQ
jgi:glucose/arabinose dehydrogenase